jgi:hypothetical protein
MSYGRNAKTSASKKMADIAMDCDVPIEEDREKEDTGTSCEPTQALDAVEKERVEVSPITVCIPFAKLIRFCFYRNKAQGT